MRCRPTVPTPCVPQPLATVKEPGLYRLTGESRKPEAERFKTWLYREVLPRIRQYGYNALPRAQPGGLTPAGRKQALAEVVRDEPAAIIRPVIVGAVRPDLP
jgi:prophage antirepressor-like protein